MANISKRNRKLEKENYDAQKNRREIIAAQLSRREMMKMGLLTSAGLLVATKGLSARARNSAGHFISGGGGGGVLPNTPPSPPTSAFTQAFTRFTVKPPVKVAPFRIRRLPNFPRKSFTRSLKLRDRSTFTRICRYSRCGASTVKFR